MTEHNTPQEPEDDYEVQLNKCKHCTELNDEGFICDEPMHGYTYICEYCNAEYYEEYGTETRNNCNKEAEITHPEFKTL